MSAWANFAKHPMQGPGWAQLPMLADIGVNGTVETSIPASGVDARCALFDPIYDLIQ